MIRKRKSFLKIQRFILVNENTGSYSFGMDPACSCIYLFKNETLQNEASLQPFLLY